MIFDLTTNRSSKVRIEGATSLRRHTVAQHWIVVLELPHEEIGSNPRNEVQALHQRVAYYMVFIFGGSNHMVQFAYDTNILSIFKVQHLE